mgnify:CR=1 FL=1
MFYDVTEQEQTPLLQEQDSKRQIRQQKRQECRTGDKRERGEHWLLRAASTAGWLLLTAVFALQVYAFFKFRKAHLEQCGGTLYWLLINGVCGLFAMFWLLVAKRRVRGGHALKLD